MNNESLAAEKDGYFADMPKHADDNSGLFDPSGVFLGDRELTNAEFMKWFLDTVKNSSYYATAPRHKHEDPESGYRGIHITPNR